MFRRILIANRGEVVARVLRTCRRLGIEVVVVHSEADRDAPYVQEADEAICIGPAPAARSYLDRLALIHAARRAGCSAVHPGWGFLSEDALFNQLCRQHGLTFVGPPPGAMRVMGRKLSAKAAARAAGLEVIPGSEGALESAAHAREVADRTGYPVILKANAGGGGRGMRVVRAPGEVEEAFSLATAEAQAAFGEAALYLERYVEGGRHIEVQVLADAYGHAVHLGERECSVQRKHQKLLEESPSPALTDEVRAATGERCARLAAQIGYQGAGTVEMLLDEGGTLRFMEMNCRLQVEHTITEARFGLDLVEAQLRVAANEPLPFTQADLRPQGHAIEVRLNAEDPSDGFRPAPGTLTRWAAPEGVRVDTHVRAGYAVPPFYDSLLAKVIAHAPDRPACIARLQAALGALEVEGVPTTRPLFQAVLESPAFRDGRYDTRAIPGWRS
ncbi:MAG: ATP-grasp domain-containing protein [Planctomycetota bacterium]|nr:ATP-grasp domain-containing protein [Planctomycetota bacterium]